MTARLAGYARKYAGVPYSWPPPDGDDSDCADFVQAVCDSLRDDGSQSR